MTPGAHYTITWEDDDGQVITSTDVVAGSVPSYSGLTPVKADEPPYFYYFLGWSPEIVAATEDATYTAVFGARTWNGDGSAQNPYVVYDAVALESVIHQARGDVSIRFADGLEYSGTLTIPARITSLSIDLNGGAIVASAADSSAISLSGATFVNLTGDGVVAANGAAPAVQIPQLVSISDGIAVTEAPSSGAGVAEPAFADSGDTTVANLAHGENNTWTITTFAELSNDSVGANVTDDMVKVYAASSVADLATAEPLDSGVEITERKSAVKTTIKVTLPSAQPSQFFKVSYGK